jgi:hypothetical protein
VRRSKGQYMIYHLSKDNLKLDAGAECHVVGTTDPYDSHALKIPTTLKKNKLLKEIRDNNQGALGED